MVKRWRVTWSLEGGMSAGGGGGGGVCGGGAEDKRKSRGENEKAVGSGDELKHPVPG